MTSAGTPPWRSLLSPLGRSLSAMEADILQLYKERGLADYRGNWSPVLLSLADTPGQTIKELAELHGVSHATMSQRIAGMVKAGLVRTEPGPDARTRQVVITAAGNDQVAFARSEWDATERAIAELDEELRGRLVRVGPELAKALQRRPFRDRLRDQLP